MNTYTSHLGGGNTERSRDGGVNSGRIYRDAQGRGA